MNILAALLNTSRATEMYLTNLELADIGHQNVVYHIILSILVLLRSHKMSATGMRCCMQWKKVKVWLHW